MDPNEYVFGWGTLMLINAGLAQSKGKSGLAWFLASFLLGPLATFVIVLFPTPTHTRDPDPDPTAPSRVADEGRRD